MVTLIVRQTRKDGASKSWKLKSSNQCLSFGTSRLADVISISESDLGIEGSFEFRDGKWWYLDLSKNFDSALSSDPLCIESPIKLQKDNYELSLTPAVSNYDLYGALEQGSLPEPDKDIKLYQLYLIKRGSKVIESAVLPFGGKFKPKSFENKKSIKPITSKTWIKEELEDGLTVLQKTIRLRDVEDISKVPMSQLIDEQSRKGLYVMLALIAFVMIFALNTPKNETETTVAEIPKSTPTVIVKTKVKKKPEPVEKKVTQPKVEKQVVAKNTAAPSSKSFIKSIAQGRISQLIGKVSAQAAKSANIVVGQGVKAGSGPTGRALSAIGPIDRAGRDWGKDAKGSDIKISTSGIGGGNSISGYGKLNKGATGAGGVGLIEEESVISGGLDRDIIAQYIKSQLGQILYCYERQLSAHPELFGKIAVRFTIGPQGSVESQKIGDSTLNNATVEGCILKKVGSWQFPAPEGGTRVLVTYPFLFKSTN